MTSRFMQASLKALNHTTRNNPNCICDIDFMNSGKEYYKYRKSTNRIYQIIINVNCNGKRNQTIYEVFRWHQRWWFSVVDSKGETLLNDNFFA